MRVAEVLLSAGVILAAVAWMVIRPPLPRVNLIGLEAPLTEVTEPLRQWQREWGPPVLRIPFPPRDSRVIELPKSELEGPGVIPAPTPPGFPEMENLPDLEASTGRER